MRPKIVAIAASTGGPAALQFVLDQLGPGFDLPVVIVQHIASGFIGALVDWLNSVVPLSVQIAEPFAELEPGHVYLAPDDRHVLVPMPGRLDLRRRKGEDRFCPSADILFHSLAASYGAGALGVVLTGMGDDGAQGLLALRRAGGQTLAQDQATAAVYGMPRAALEIGAAQHSLPLNAIAATIRRLCNPLSHSPC